MLPPALLKATLLIKAYHAPRELLAKLARRKRSCTKLTQHFSAAMCSSDSPTLTCLVCQLEYASKRRRVGSNVSVYMFIFGCLTKDGYLPLMLSLIGGTSIKEAMGTKRSAATNPTSSEISKAADHFHLQSYLISTDFQSC